MKEILYFLFPVAGDSKLPDLCDVCVMSNRGYFMPSLVFSFVISSAGDVVGTTKRMLCWSFNFANDGRFINDKDKRKRLSIEEAPSLFVKKVERFKTVTEIVKVPDYIFSIPSL